MGPTTLLRFAMKTARSSRSNFLPDAHRCARYGFHRCGSLPPLRAALGQVGRIVSRYATKASSAATRTPCQSARRAASLGNGAGFEIMSAHRTWLVRSARSLAPEVSLANVARVVPPNGRATLLNPLREIPREHRKSTAPGV